MDAYELMVGVYSVALTAKVSIFELYVLLVFLALLAPWSGKTSKLSLKNRRRYRLSHQYAC